VDYIQVDHSNVNFPHSIQACENNVDAGGNNVGWLFATSGYCMSIQFQPMLIQMGVILFMMMGVIIAVGIILGAVKRIGKAGDKDDQAS
jgi:hypothetical protein